MRIKGVMGDAAMNVAASGGGGQRVVKEGWLQKRGTTEEFHNIYVYFFPSFRSGRVQIEITSSHFLKSSPLLSYPTF